MRHTQKVWQTPGWPLLAALLGFLVTVAYWGSEAPRGADTWGHMSRAFSLAQAMDAEGPVVGFVNANWIPGWYMGDPSRETYAPMAYNILGILTYLAKDPIIGQKIYISLASTVLALLVYLVTANLWNSPITAIFAAIMVVTAPFAYIIWFVQGNMARTLVLLSVPVVFWGTEKMLSMRHVGMPLIFSTLGWVFALLSHPHQGLILACGIILYIAVRVVDDNTIPLRRFVLPLFSIGLGAGICSPYLLPLYFGKELGGSVTIQSGLTVQDYSVQISNFLPVFLQSPGSTILPTGALLLATLAVLSRPDPVRKALYLVGAVSVFMALKINQPLYMAMPFSSFIIPDRFLDMGTVLLAITAAGLVPVGHKLRGMRIVILGGLMLLDSASLYQLMIPNPMPANSYAIAQELASLPDDTGRLLQLHQPEPFSSDIYMGNVVGGKQLIQGWNSALSHSVFSVRRMIYAAEYYPTYTQRMISLWNIRYATVRHLPDKPEYAHAALTQSGFDLVNEVGDMQLWRLDTPSAPLQIVSNNRMLVIGSNLTSWVAAFPWASEGDSGNLNAYDQHYLDNFSYIGLTHFSGDTPEALTTFENWVADGGTLIVDMSGFGTQFAQGYQFMGVQVVPTALDGERTLIWSDNLKNMPDKANFLDDETGGAWVGATYLGLEKVLAEIDNGADQRQYALLGYKTIGKGRVWFIGFNYLYYLDVKKDFSARDTLAEYLTDDPGLDKSLSYQRIQSTPLAITSHTATLTYNLDRPVQAMLSMTYSPRWEAQIDGAFVPIRSHEYMMLLDLPAGTHTLSLSYNPLATLWSRAGWVVGIASILMLILISYYLNSQPLGLIKPVKLGKFIGSDRKEQRDEWFATCPNCRFRLAVAEPPNSATYPFNVMRCPVCDYRLDEEGFDPGQSRTAVALNDIAREWLLKQGYDLSRLREKVGFGADELFDSNQEESMPVIPPFFPDDIEDSTNQSSNLPGQ